jgi:hypothetical protein
LFLAEKFSFLPVILGYYAHRCSFYS